MGDAHWSCVSYDPRSRPATATDAAGNVTTINYHDATTPGTVTQSSPDSAGTPRTVTAVTDLLGRSASYSDEQAGTTTAVYDQPGRLTDTYRAVFGGAATHLTTTGYDGYDRPSTATGGLVGSRGDARGDHQHRLYDHGGLSNVCRSREGRSSGHGRAAKGCGGSDVAESLVSLGHRCSLRDGLRMHELTISCRRR